MDSRPAAGSLAQAEGEELLSSRCVQVPPPPIRSGKPRARLARILLPREVVMCPLSATLAEGSVGHSTASPKVRGHPGLPVLPPVLTLQKKTKSPTSSCLCSPFPHQE